MIYDMRIYDLKPGAVPRYMEAARDIALKIRADYGVKLAGWYYTDIGPLNRIVHIGCDPVLGRGRKTSQSIARWLRLGGQHG